MSTRWSSEQIPGRAAQDEDVAARLWAVSEELTYVRFELGAGTRE